MFSSTLTLFSLLAPFVLAASSSSSSSSSSKASSSSSLSSSSSASSTSSASPSAPTPTNVPFDIEGVEANFENAGLVPSLLSTFDPVALLQVSFGKVIDVTPGQNLTVDQVKSAPTLIVVPANSSVALNGNYTVAMVDADVVGSSEVSQTRHWLVNDVSITNSSEVDVKSAKVITDYAGPAPPVGSGPHRYVILIYTQPANFTPPANLSSTTPVGTYDFPAYVNATGLQGPVAANYIQVEQGAATVTLSSTAAVVSSTLPAATATGTGAKASHSGAASSVLYQNSAAGLGLVGLLASLLL